MLIDVSFDYKAFGCAEQLFTNIKSGLFLRQISNQAFKLLSYKTGCLSITATDINFFVQCHIFGQTSLPHGLTLLRRGTIPSAWKILDRLIFRVALWPQDVLSLYQTKQETFASCQVDYLQEMSYVRDSGEHVYTVYGIFLRTARR